MQFVCNDINGPSVWKFEDGKYYRFNEKGEQYRSISGEQLPDPYLLWGKRKRVFPKADPTALRPQEAIFALWADWQKRVNG